MDCNQVRELLHPLADGELEPALEEQVLAALADCDDCQAELREIEAVRSLAREAFSAPVEEVDFSHFYQDVMTRIEVDAPAAEAAISGVPVTVEGVPVLREDAPAESLWQRFMAWFGELVRFERPLAAAASAAVIALLVGGIFWMQQSTTTPEGGAPGLSAPVQGTSIAQADNGHRMARRGREGETRLDNSASVEDIEVAIGRYEIDNSEDPDRPMVVWHIVDDGATAAPEREL